VLLVLRGEHAHKNVAVHSCHAFSVVELRQLFSLHRKSQYLKQLHRGGDWVMLDSQTLRPHWRTSCSYAMRHTRAGFCRVYTLQLSTRNRRRELAAGSCNITLSLLL